MLRGWSNVMKLWTFEHWYAAHNKSGQAEDSYSYDYFCQAQLQLQLQLSWKLNLTLISFYPTIHIPPDGLVVELQLYFYFNFKHNF